MPGYAPNCLNICAFIRISQELSQSSLHLGSRFSVFQNETESLSQELCLILRLSQYLETSRFFSLQTLLN